jgi:hypothetical protein
VPQQGENRLATHIVNYYSLGPDQPTGPSQVEIIDVIVRYIKRTGREVFTSRDIIESEEGQIYHEGSYPGKIRMALTMNKMTRIKLIQPLILVKQVNTAKTKK